MFLLLSLSKTQGEADDSHWIILEFTNKMGRWTQQRFFVIFVLWLKCLFSTFKYMHELETHHFVTSADGSCKEMCRWHNCLQAIKEGQHSAVFSAWLWQEYDGYYLSSLGPAGSTSLERGWGLPVSLYADARGRLEENLKAGVEPCQGLL